MWSTLIEDGSVGPFHNPNNPEMVTIGCKQSMVYDELEIGPFDLSPQDRQSLKYDVVETLPAERQKTVN